MKRIIVAALVAITAVTGCGGDAYGADDYYDGPTQADIEAQEREQERERREMVDKLKAECTEDDGRWATVYTAWGEVTTMACVPRGAGVALGGPNG